MHKFKLVASGVCAIALSFVASQTLAQSKFAAGVVPVPAKFDAANANGAGNMPQIPPNKGTGNLTGVKICVGPGGPSSTCGGKTLCTAVSCTASSCLFANAGSTCSSDANCYGSTCQATGEPDGVGAEDTAAGTHTLNGLKSACSVSGTKIAVKAVFGNPVDTTFNTPITALTHAGSCQGGAICSTLINKKICFGGTKAGKTCTVDATCLGGGTCGNYCTAGPGNQTTLGKKQQCVVDNDCLCAKSADCGKDSNKFAGQCLDGSEYVAQVNGTIGTTPTTSCKPCLIEALELTSCIVGTCTAGDPIRPGQACQSDGDCFTGPGGCQLPVPTTPTHYAAFKLGPVHAIPLCPFQFALSFPFEVKKGAGAVSVNLATSTLGASVTPGTDSDAISCLIREPGYTQVSSLGFITGTTIRQNTYTGRPIPDLTVPLAGNSSGLHSNQGTGAIIGVTGSETK